MTILKVTLLVGGVVALFAVAAPLPQQVPGQQLTASAQAIVTLPR